jgi:DAACS family dicarboxylate/amino acid:cation (Na+ or H+) symporter
MVRCVATLFQGIAPRIPAPQRLLLEPIETVESAEPSRSRFNPLNWPLYGRVLLGVVLGTLIGHFFGTRPILFDVTTRHLGELGLLVIRLLTTLCTPLILFAILEAFVRTQITGRQGMRMVFICAFNIAVAFVIGLTIMNTWQPGLAWRGKLEELTSRVQAGEVQQSQLEEPGLSLSPIDLLKLHTPKSILEPFLNNDILAVVFLAVLTGVALRHVRHRQQLAGEVSIQAVEHFIEAGYQMMMRMLDWMVQIVPIAVFGAVAMVVGESGLEVFQILWVFLASTLLGLGIHSLLYYPLSAWLIGRRSPRIYLGRGADAITTGLSTNSSLVTVPVTLKCLTQRMGISQESARLSACVGTNFNNDGITLYEAMSVLFVAQAAGYDLNLGQQIGVVTASLLASVGVAGIPGSGMIVLPLVMKAAGLPEHIILVAFPLVQTVDWILARVRSGVNVMGDMQVAILLDAVARLRPAAEIDSAELSSEHVAVTVES